MPADHARRTITGVNEMNQMSGEKWRTEISGKRNYDKARQKPTLILFRPLQKLHRLV